MFGAFVDAIMQIPNNMHKEEMQDDAQTHSEWMLQRNQHFNAVEAAENRNWQEKMSNSAYQRATSDMRAAGLNPIMAATRAAGATTPGGSAASSSGSSSSGQSGGSGPSNFNQGDLNYSAKKLMKAQEISTDQQAYNYSADTEKKHAERRLLTEQEATQRHITRRASEEAEIAESNAKGRATEEEIDNTTYGRIMRYIDRLRGGSSAYRNFQSR